MGATSGDVTGSVNQELLLRNEYLPPKIGFRKVGYTEAVSLNRKWGVPGFGTLLIVFRTRETIW